MEKIPETGASIETGKTGIGPNSRLQQNNISAALPQLKKVQLRYYKDIVFSSLLIVTLFVIASVGIAFLITRNIKPTYQATTTIMVSKGTLGQSLTYDAIMAGQNQARTYAEMITSRGVLEQVSQELGDEISPAELRSAISATPIVNTQLIEINVEQPDPELAVKIANGLVGALSVEIKKTQTDMETYQDNLLNSQLTETQKQISQLQDSIAKHSLQVYNQRLDTINNAIDNLKEEIASLNEEMAPLQIKSRLNPSERINLSNMQSHKEELSSLLKQYQDELVSLRVEGPTYDALNLDSNQDTSLLNQYQRNYLILMENYSNLTMNRLQNSVSVTQVDRPSLPENPIRPNYKINIMLGFVIGLFLAFIFILIKRWNLNSKLGS